MEWRVGQSSASYLICRSAEESDNWLSHASKMLSKLVPAKVIHNPFPPHIPGGGGTDE
jgi:hypothetical protein